MSAGLANVDRRRFGRRETIIKGHAILPGYGKKPFVIRNISDGGAHLVFEDGFCPPRLFRIELDGMPFKVACELRHERPNGIGVSFTSPADGIAINRHFLLKPVVVKPAATLVAPRAVDCPAAAPVGRDLRRSLGLPVIPAAV
jgi:hypothetical protein